jgi:cysteinyl-tRNA synthetase
MPGGNKNKRNSALRRTGGRPEKTAQHGQAWQAIAAHAVCDDFNFLRTLQSVTALVRADEAQSAQRFPL